MANILSVNEEHVFEQIKSAHSVYSRFEDDVCPASDFRSSLEALPEHDMRMAMQQDIFLKYADLCSNDMQSILSMVSSLTGCDMNMATIVSQSSLDAEKIRKSRFYQNRTSGSNTGKGGHR